MCVFDMGTIPSPSDRAVVDESIKPIHQEIGVRAGVTAPGVGILVWFTSEPLNLMIHK